jgi:hypothetical protein
MRAFANIATAPADSPLAAVSAKRTYAQLIADVQADQLAQVTWLMPAAWCSEHPVYTPADGATYIAAILDALTSNPRVCATCARPRRSHDVWPDMSKPARRVVRIRRSAAERWPMLIQVAAGTRSEPRLRGSRLFELLGQLETLSLVVGFDPLSIQSMRNIGHALEAQPTNGLAMLQQKGHFV